MMSHDAVEKNRDASDCPDELFVMCDHYTNDCPDHCIHSKPHKPFLDMYDDGEYYCNSGIGTCGHLANAPECVCS